GRVTRQDARAAIATRASGAARTPGAAPDAQVALTSLRRAIGEHLLRARAQAAHAHVIVACDYTRVEHVRHDAHLTYLPFVARAVLDALAEYPQCNATADTKQVVVHPSVGLGIAVDLDFDGLIVPVLH